MVKSVSEFKFDMVANYVRTKKRLDVHKMLPYLEKNCNTVKVQNNKNNDDLIILFLKQSQYKNSNAGPGVMIEQGKIVKNVNSKAINTYNNIIKSCGNIPIKYNTKYLVLHQDFYDRNERESSLRTLYVSVSHVVNLNGKSRVLIAAYPEPRESAADIVHKAIEQENALARDHPYCKIVSNMKINDEHTIYLDISTFTQSLIKLYPMLDRQSLNEQLKYIFVGLQIKKVVKRSNNIFAHCATFDLGNFKNIRQVGLSKGTAILNNDIIYITDHDIDMRVKSINGTTPDYLVQLTIDGSTSFDYSGDVMKGRLTYAVRVFSTIIDPNNSNNNSINNNSKKDIGSFFSGLFSPVTSYIPEQPSSYMPPYTPQAGGAAFVGGLSEGMGTANSTDPCNDPTGWRISTICVVGGLFGDLGSGGESN